MPAAANTNLKKFSLHFGFIDEESGWPFLAKALACTQDLVSLQFTVTDPLPFEQESLASALGSAVMGMRGLTSFQTNMWQFEAGVAAAFLPAFANLYALEVLALTSATIGNDGAQALAEALSTAKPPLRLVDLSECAISDAGGVPLINALAMGATLAKLDLTGNDLGEPSALALAPLVARHTGLRLLVVEGCEFEQRGLAAIAREVRLGVGGVHELEDVVGVTFNTVRPRSVSSHARAVVADRSFPSVLRCTLRERTAPDSIAPPFCRCRRAVGMLACPVLLCCCRPAQSHAVLSCPCLL